MLNTLAQLEEKLCDLGYRDVEGHRGIPCGQGVDPAVHNVVVRLVLNFVEPNCPMTEGIGRAFQRLLEFFDLAAPLLGTVRHALQSFCMDLRQSREGQGRVTKDRFPIAYFMQKAHELAAFPHIAVPGRDLIMSNGASAIPPLLVVCNTLGPNLRPSDLLPKHILRATAKYRHKRKFKKGLRKKARLAKATSENYQRHLKRLVVYIREVYRIIGCANPDLYAAEEVSEANGRARRAAKVYLEEKKPPSFSYPDVLKPPALDHILLDGTFDASSDEAFNLSVKKLYSSMVFHFGSKGRDIRSWSTKDYLPDQKLIAFKVNPDLLLQEKTIYVPLHGPFTTWIDDMLAFKATYGHANPHDNLFCLRANGGFREINKEEMRRFFVTISQLTGVKVSERTLHLSHLCYYQGEGGLDPVIDDRISDRRQDRSFMARLYTTTSVDFLRTRHFASFTRVASRLGAHYESVLHGVAGENRIYSGGKRTPERRAIKAFFSHFQKRGFDTFENCVKWLVFLLNYLTGSRVDELCTLDMKCVDLQLGVIKFRVKDTFLRKDTTKVLPIPPYLGEQIKHYLRLRREVLLREGRTCFTSFLFEVGQDGPRPLTDKDVNGYYREIIESTGTHFLTSHWIRYGTQSELVRACVNFRYINCILSHYPLMDPIFSPSATISFADFRREYLRAVEEMLKEIT